MISKSPERNSFQVGSYKKKLEEDPSDKNAADMIEFYENYKNDVFLKENDPAWQKDNLEYDLRTTDWILEKVRTSDVYAQNLYAAMCNNDFIKREFWPLLKEQKWGCSWRSAGGIISNMQQKGDYIDWYCSGIRDPDDSGFVSESFVTEEIEKDLYTLGWIVVKYTGE